MKNDEFKNSNEFNSFDEFKEIKSEQYNFFEYNKKSKEYKDVNEMNFNNKEKENPKRPKDKDNALNNDVDNIKKFSNSLKHSLSTVATTIGSSAVVVAASAAIVTNVFVPNPKINFDINPSYTSVDYRIEMTEVDESLDYFIILGNNNDSYKVEIPKDDNPDDHIINYEGRQDHLEDNETYHLNVFGEDKIKGTSSNFYKTKFVTKKYTMPVVMYGFESSYNEQSEKLEIKYKINLDNFKESNKKYYVLDIKYNNNIIKTERLNGDSFTNILRLDKDVYLDLADGYGMIYFNVYEVKKGNKNIVETYSFDGKDLQPEVNFNGEVKLSPDKSEMSVKYYINLTKFHYIESLGRVFKVNIKYDGQIIDSYEFMDYKFNNEYVIPNEVLMGLLNNRDSNLIFEVLEEVNGEEILLKENFINLKDYNSLVEFNITPSLNNLRDKLILDYDVLINNPNPSKVTTYTFKVKYMDEVIGIDENYDMGNFNKKLEIGGNILNKILYSNNKELVFEVLENTNGIEKVTSSKILDLSKYFVTANIILTEEYVPDYVKMNLKYQVELNGDTSLFNKYDIEFYQNGEIKKVNADFVDGVYQGVLEGVSEGEIRLVVSTKVMNEPLILGEKMINIVYPEVQLSQGDVTVRSEFDKANRSSMLKMDTIITSKKPLDTYRLEVRNSLNELIKTFDITSENQTFTLENVIAGDYKFIIYETKVGVDYKLNEVLFTHNYPADFFTDIVVANMEYQPMFSADLGKSDLKIFTAIENTYPNNKYYLTMNKGEYFSYTSPEFTSVDNFNNLFENLKPGTYHVEMFIKEIYQTSKIYSFDYEFVYPDGHLEAILSPHTECSESFDNVNKLAPITFTPTILDIFKDASYTLTITSDKGYNFTSNPFKVSDNFKHVIDNAKDGEYTMNLKIILDGVTYDLITETFGHYYPNDYDPLPDTNFATFDKITSNDITVDVNTKPGFLLINVPLNYMCDDSRFYYDIELNSGMSTLASLTYQTSNSVVLEVEAGELGVTYIYIMFKVREDWREKQVESYTVEGNLYLGGPELTLGEYKQETQGTLTIPISFKYNKEFETIKDFTYTATFNDGYEVTNTVPFDENLKSVTITGYNSDVTSMRFNSSINYRAPHGMGERNKVFYEEFLEFTTIPVVSRSIVRAHDAYVSGGTNIELDFTYFGPSNLTLVIESAGTELHRGGLSYKGPMDALNATYDCYLEDSGGARVGNATQINIDASSYQIYDFTPITENDVLVTRTDNGKYNYYMDYGFTSVKQETYYVVNFIDPFNNQVVKSVRSRSNVFVIENLDSPCYTIDTQVYTDELPLVYQNTNNPKLVLSTKDFNAYVTHRIWHRDVNTLEVTFLPGFEVDKNNVRVEFEDGSIVNLTEANFRTETNGDVIASVEFTGVRATLVFMGSMQSSSFTNISSKVTVTGNRFMEYRKDIVDAV